MAAPENCAKPDDSQGPTQAKSTQGTEPAEMEQAPTYTQHKSSPVTKQNFHNLVVEIKNLLVADMAIFNTDIQAVTYRVKS
ncbi:Hypothetical predicted protein [Pelobates cultripes]|uniref:Uncharacterized protein n=1 Tax=Pelobates cultripes TaxID=61616 RepID=A0AAD1RF68_PELCU|nr:Hypothetical predicted protein [Pelobates cultripes]